MDWSSLMTLSFAGLAASTVVIVFAVFQGIRYQKWLPKRDTAESLEALKLQLEERREEWDRLNSEAVMARADIDRGEEARRWMSETREEVALLESKKREFDEVDRKIANQRSEYEDIAKAVAGQKRELLPDAEFQSMLERQKELKQELPSLEDWKNKLEVAIKGLESQRDTESDALNSVVAKKEAFIEQSEALEHKVAAARAEVVGLEERRNSLQKQIEDLRETKSAIGGTGGEQNAEHATELLWQPVLKADDFQASAQVEQDEQAVLGDVLARIKAKNFIYHERVIKAFHTSLKCAADAPLTVLAGISGTGKSALPTRYAEAIGMHIKTVPVQPGWDSPADLLGFYNHLEQRYRPTELMRALIQMDYVHGGAGGARGGLGSWPSHADQRTDLSDRMLLVLLDEMNLARVEYYFSEFLSRLELRRGIAEKSEVDRRDSELVLDLGSMGVDVSQELRVFLGRNVLFVGTMNEDESTQTLSDKVIDRSNVMRFGRPKRLHIEGLNNSPPREKPRALHRATWAQWIEGATMEERAMRQVDTWIETLNGALSGIGKPFAYRVSEAIRSYAKLYPRQSERDLKDAVADQVELRILPRLRGLDLHYPSVGSAIDSVYRLVADELEDNLLAAALDQARRTEGDQLFHWTGLDRTATETGVGV